MSIERTKVLEVAQKFLTKGQLDKAILEFRKIVQADPSDVRTWLKIGDLSTRLNQKEAAIDAYIKAADQYADQGFFDKAVAVYKLVLNVDPNRVDIMMRLGEMYEMLHLHREALSIYEQLSDRKLKEGNFEQAVDFLKRIVEIEPENIPMRIKLAETYSKASKTKEAAEAFQLGADLLKKQGRMDDYIKVVERLLFHRADDKEVSRELAQLYLERDDTKRALARLQMCLKADPKDTNTLELLARVFASSDQTPKAISVYKEIARLHHEGGRKDLQKSVLEKIAKLDPSDRDVQKELSVLAGVPLKQEPSIKQPQSNKREEPLPPLVSTRTDVSASPFIEPPAAVSRRASSLRSESKSTEQQHLVQKPAVQQETASHVSSAEIEVLEMSEAEFIESNSDEILFASGEVEHSDDLLEGILNTEGLSSDRRKDLKAKAESQNVTSQKAIHQQVSFGKPLKSNATRAEAAEVKNPTSPTRSGSHEMPPLKTKQGSGRSTLGDRVHAILSESEAFIRERKFQNVVHLMQEALGMDPEHVDARTRLATSLLELGRTREAIEEYRVLARTNQTFWNTILLLDPHDSEAKHVLGVKDSIPSAGSERDSKLISMPAPAKGAGQINVESKEEEVLFFEDSVHNAPALQHQISVEPAQPDMASKKLEPLSRSTAKVDVDSRAPVEVVPEAFDFSNVETAFEPSARMFDRNSSELKQPAQGERSSAEPLVLVQEPSFNAPHQDRTELSEPNPQMFASDPQANHSASKRPSLRPVLQLDKPESLRPKSVEDYCEEADFYLLRGLGSNAQTVIQEALNTFPAHPLLTEKLSEISEQTSSINIGVELAEKIADGFVDVSEYSNDGAASIDVDRVFEALEAKRQSPSVQAGSADSDTQFDLGIAYREMQLIDDAIAAFTEAAKYPQRMCSAFTMIGLCFMDRGQMQEAIGMYQQALSAPVRTQQEELTVYESIGLAYEAAGMPNEAVQYYQAIVNVDPTFRNVRDKLDHLQFGKSLPPPPTEDDDLDAAFDLLLKK